MTQGTEGICVFEKAHDPLSARKRRRSTAPLVDAPDLLDPAVRAVSYEEESVRTFAEDRMPSFVVSMCPMELFQITASVDADTRFDPRHPFRKLFLHAGSESRLDERLRGRMARFAFAPDEMVWKDPGTGHCRAERCKGYAFEKRCFSAAVSPYDEVHVRESRTTGLQGNRHLGMDEVDGRLLERPKFPHYDRIDVHGVSVRWSGTMPSTIMAPVSCASPFLPANMPLQFNNSPPPPVTPSSLSPSGSSSYRERLP